jgi:hypothetical protein
MSAEPSPILRFPEGFREGPFHLHALGLASTGKPTFDQWQQIGNRIKTTYKGIHWAIGDWILFGERMFSQDFAQGLDDCNFSYETLRNDRRVALAVEPARRRPELPFDFYLAVVSESLSPGEQEQLLDRALAGKWSRDQLRKAVREFKLDKRRQEAKGTAPEVLPLPGEAGSDSSPQAVSLLAGRFQDLLPRLPPGSVDLILCRPPQDADAMQTFADLAHKSYRPLRDQGSLIVQAPTAYLGEVISLMSAHLRYWWTLSITSAGGYLEGKGVAIRWQPWVWLVKGGRRGDATVNDALMEAPIPYLVGRLTVEGEVVLDPLCGTGEVLTAAHGMGRALIGMDPDPANVAMAQRRLAVSSPDSSR